MIPQSGTILCVESNESSPANRCKVLSVAGYAAVSASPVKALEILSDRMFDLIVTAGLSDIELKRIQSVANGAEFLPLDDRTVPTLLLFLVDERLRNLRREKG